MKASRMFNNILIDNKQTIVGAITSITSTIVGNLTVVESTISIVASFIGIMVGLLTIMKIGSDLWERRKKRIRIAERREKLSGRLLNQDITRKGEEDADQ